MLICLSALLCVAHYLHSLKSERKRVIIMLTKKDCALQHPYQTRAKTKIMIDIEQVQEQMKASMEAMKE